MALPDEIRSELKTLNEQIEQNHIAVRERVDRLEKADKVNGESAAAIRAVVDEINEEFVGLRQREKELTDKLARYEAIQQMAGEAATSIAAQQRREAINIMLRKAMAPGGEGFARPESLLTEEQRNLLYPATETRALGSMFDSEGGALIPIDFEQQIFKAVYTLPGFRNIVTARPTGTKEASVITMGSISGQWIGEGETTTQQSTTFGNVTIPVHDLRVEVPIPRNLLDDAAADLMGELTDAIAQKLAEMEDISFISGNGVKKPQGLFTDAATQANYVATGVAADIFDSTHNGVDMMRTAPTTLKQAHRMRGSWFMSSQTEARVRNLKDTYGQYLYHTNVAQSGPATFDGYAVNISDNCPAVAANAYPMAFGDFNAAYAIRDRQGLTTEVDFSVYRRQDMVAIYVKKRVGGRPVVTSTPAVCLIKCATS